MSGFARTWLVSMYARRKVDRFEVETDDELRAAVSNAAHSAGEREGMLKDIHLVEAALQATAPVASLDENTAHGPFRNVCRTVRRLQRVVWVNPTKEDENALEWLSDGAPTDPARCLGFGVADRGAA